MNSSPSAKFDPKRPSVKLLLHFWISLIRVILPIASLTTLAHYEGWLEPFELANFDIFATLYPHRQPPGTMVVRIDQKYFDSAFNGSLSNLNELGKLIDAVAKGGAAVVGIDLLPPRSAMIAFHEKPDWPPIVWAVERIEEDGVAKAALPALPRGMDGAGIAALPEDSDGLVRRYMPFIEVDGGEVSSLPHAIAQAYDKRLGASKGGEGVELRLGTFGTGFRHVGISADDVMRVSQDSDWPNGSLRGKVVLIGGEYVKEDGDRDLHRTPAGDVSGCDLMALATDSELRGGGIHSLSEWAGFSLDIFSGLALTALHLMVRERVSRSWLIVLEAGVVFFTFSFLLYLVGSWWLSSVPTILGVMAHEIHHHGSHAKDHPEAAEMPKNKVTEGSTPPTHSGHNKHKDPKNKRKRRRAAGHR